MTSLNEREAGRQAEELAAARRCTGVRVHAAQLTTEPVCLDGRKVITEDKLGKDGCDWIIVCKFPCSI